MPQSLYVEYLRTVAAFQRFEAANGKQEASELIGAFARDVKAAMGLDGEASDDDVPMVIRSDYFIKIGRKKV